MTIMIIETVILNRIFYSQIIQFLNITDLYVYKKHNHMHHRKNHFSIFLRNLTLGKLSYLYEEKEP